MGVIFVYCFSEFKAQQPLWWCLTAADCAAASVSMLLLSGHGHKIIHSYPHAQNSTINPVISDFLLFKSLKIR